jgi:hypothetical protein
MNTILAIDPGDKESAFVLWNGAAVLAKEILPNSAFLQSIRRYEKLSILHGVAIERVASYGMPVGKEVFETCFWTGRFWEEVSRWEAMPCALIPRLAVKVAICHDSRAKDANLNRAIKDRFGADGGNGKGTKANPGVLYGIKEDLWAALALAVAVVDEPRLMEEHSASKLQ